MAEQFKKGDIVSLKSGGPAMTILGPSENFANGWVVTWFDDPPYKGLPNTWEFDEDVLDLEDDFDFDAWDDDELEELVPDESGDDEDDEEDEDEADEEEDEDEEPNGNK